MKKKKYVIYGVLILFAWSMDALPSYFPSSGSGGWFFFTNDSLGWEVSEDWDDGKTTSLNSGIKIESFSLGMEARMLTSRGAMPPSRNDNLILWGMFQSGHFSFPLQEMTLSVGGELNMLLPLGGLFFQEGWHSLVNVPRPVPRDYGPRKITGGLEIFLEDQFSFPLRLESFLYVGMDRRILQTGALVLELPPEVIDVSLGLEVPFYDTSGEISRSYPLRGELYFQNIYAFKEITLGSGEQDGGLGIVLNSRSRKEKLFPLQMTLGIPLFYNAYLMKLRFGEVPFRLLLELSNGFVPGCNRGEEVIRYSFAAGGGDWVFFELPWAEFFLDLTLGCRQEWTYSALMTRAEVLEEKYSLSFRTGTGGRFFLPFSYTPESRIGVDLAINLRGSIPGTQSCLPFEFYGTIAFLVEQKK